MSEHFIETDGQLYDLHKLLDKHKLPFVAEIKKGSARSLAQNRLYHLWMREIAAQWEGNTPTEVRAYCKLVFGVPIMREESEKFRELYDRALKPLSYEDKIALMQEPIDLAVSRCMSVDQMTRYIDCIFRFAGENGWALTDPDEKLYKAMVATRRKEAA